MAADIVPELYKDIKRDYVAAVSGNRHIQKFLKDLENEKATPEEVSLYAAELGFCAAEALEKNLTEDRLPGGRIYWNILERTVEPLLKEILKKVNEAAVKVQKKEDEKTEIGIQPMEADYPVYRIRDLMDKLVGIFEGEIAADE
ncbi:MAG: hypothetical protein MJ086_03460 [Lachnospiraceae bacterium]|nr:hypothetical protein [Lachnospiraceae bacterium]